MGSLPEAGMVFGGGGSELAVMCVVLGGGGSELVVMCVLRGGSICAVVLDRGSAALTEVVVEWGVVLGWLVVGTKLLGVVAVVCLTTRA